MARRIGAGQFITINIIRMEDRFTECIGLRENIAAFIVEIGGGKATAVFNARDPCLHIMRVFNTLTIGINMRHQSAIVVVDITRCAYTTRINNILQIVIAEIGVACQLACLYVCLD